MDSNKESAGELLEHVLQLLDGTIDEAQDAAVRFSGAWMIADVSTVHHPVGVSDDKYVLIGGKLATFSKMIDAQIIADRLMKIAKVGNRDTTIDLRVMKVVEWAPARIEKALEQQCRITEEFSKIKFKYA